MKILLNSFHPLCSTGTGRRAITVHHLPPFIDGSVRREPNFESEYPGISSLCRKGKLVNRLAVDDIVVYIPIKGDYGQSRKHWKLVSILKAHSVMEDHQTAADWYKNRGLDVPKNCVVPGNEPLPWGFTSMTEQKARIATVGYNIRARTITRYVICDSQYTEVHTPRAIYEDDFRTIFKKIPGTQNPCQITLDQLNALQKLGLS